MLFSRAASRARITVLCVPTRQALALQRSQLLRSASRCSFFTVVEQFQKGLVFHSGRHVGEKKPGIRFSFPVVNEIRKVDMRTRTMQIPSQELMTKDNVTIHVDAVAFFRVSDALKAICNIEDRDTAVSEAAQSSLRDQLSQAVFDEVLHDREEAASNVLAALCTLTDKWGIVVDAVKLKNISVDVSMIRAMGRRAEAERLKEARIIEASAEFEASRMLVKAGREFGDGALGLRLRELQTYSQIAAEKNTILIPSNLDASVAQALRTLRQEEEMKQNQGILDGSLPTKNSSKLGNSPLKHKKGNQSPTEKSERTTEAINEETEE